MTWKLLESWLDIVAGMGLVVLVSTATARAGIVQSDYDFAGTLAEVLPTHGDLVSGHFTLDSTSASITSFDFMTPVGEISPANYTSMVSTFTTTAPNADFVLLSFVTYTDNVLALLFETDLSSFSGSTFVTNPVPLPHGQVQSQLICVSGAAGCTLEFGVLDYEPTFTSGIATPLVSQNVAEPGSLSLVAAGLAGLTIMLRIVRRRSAVRLTKLPA